MVTCFHKSPRLLVLIAAAVLHPLIAAAGTTFEEVMKFDSIHAKARAGDAVSQYETGRCYASGLGVAINYASAVEWLLKSSDQDYAPAHTALGSCYANGYGVRKDPLEAYAYYSLAAPRDAEAQKNLNFLDGILSIEAREQAIQRSKEMLRNLEEIKKAKAEKEALAKAEFSRCKSAAYKGDRGEMLKLGTYFASGHGTPKDKIEAWAFWNLARNSDYSLGMTAYPKSTEEMEKRQKESELASKFATQYINDLERGMSYDQKSRAIDRSAAIADEIKSLIKQPALGALTSGEVKPSISEPAVIPPDKIKAFKELVASAETGDADAQFKVGQAYFNGDGVVADVFEGAKWYRKSAEQGNVNAQWSLANAYDYFEDKRLGDRLGIGIYECARQSLKWWLMAAEKGHVPSQFKYANKCYNELKGTYVSGSTAMLFPENERPRYMALALKWALSASLEGDTEAQYLLGMIYDDGYAFGERRLEDAFVWYSLSAAGGKSWAKSKVDTLELLLDSSVISRAKSRISTFKSEMDSKRLNK